MLHSCLSARATEDSYAVRALCGSGSPGKAEPPCNLGEIVSEACFASLVRIDGEFPLEPVQRGSTNS